MMAPEMMQPRSTSDLPRIFTLWCGDVGSLVRRNLWSELSAKQEIFKAVREDKRRLKAPSDGETIQGYEKMMRSCTEYKADRRPLIDSVRSDLQVLLEGAAEADSKLHLHRQDSVDKPLEMMKDTKTDTPNELCSSRESTGFQGGNSSSSSPPVHIQMGTIETSCQ